MAKKSKEQLEAELNGWGYTYNAAKRRGDTKGMAAAHAAADKLRQEAGWSYDEKTGKTVESKHAGRSSRTVNSTRVMDNAKIWNVKDVKPFVKTSATGRSSEGDHMQQALDMLRTQGQASTYLTGGRASGPMMSSGQIPKPIKVHDSRLMQLARDITESHDAAENSMRPHITQPYSYLRGAPTQHSGPISAAGQAANSYAGRPSLAREAQAQSRQNLTDFLYNAENLAAGAAGAVEDAGRFVSGQGNKILSSITSLGGFADNPVSDYLREQAEKTLSGSFTDQWKQSIEERYNPSETAQAMKGLNESAGAMLPTLLASAASSGASLFGGIGKGASMTDAATKAAQQLASGLGLSAMFPSVSGASTRKALQEGATLNQALAYGTASGALEVATESMFSGMPTMKTGVVSDVIRKVSKSPALNRVADILGEGVEEVVSGIISPYLARLTYDEQAELATRDELIESFVVGAALSAVMQGTTDAMNIPDMVRGRSTIDLNQLGPNSRKNYTYAKGQDTGTPGFDAQWKRYNDAGRSGIPLDQVPAYPTDTPISAGQAYGAHAAGLNDYTAAAIDVVQEITSGKTVSDQVLDRALDLPEARQLLEAAVEQPLPERYKDAREVVRNWQEGQREAAAQAETNAQNAAQTGNTTEENGTVVTTPGTNENAAAESTETVTALKAMNDTRMQNAPSESEPVSNEPVASPEETRAHAVQTADQLAVESMNEESTRRYRAFAAQAEDPDAFYRGWRAYHEAGQVGADFQTVDSLYSDALTDEARQAAYQAGATEAQDSVSRAVSRVGTLYGDADAGLVRNDAAKKLGRKDAEFIDLVSRALGVKTYVGEAMGAQENAYIEGTQVHISKDSEGARPVVKHEITHRMQELAPAEYKAFRDFAVQKAARGDISALVDKYKAAYGDHGVRTTERAMDEIAADYAMQLMTDGKSIRDFVSGQPKAARSFWTQLKNIITRIKNALTGKRMTPEQKQFAAELDEAERLWLEAFNAAEAQNAKLTTENGQKNSASSSGRRFYKLNESDLDAYLKAGTRANKAKQEAVARGQKVILTSESETRAYISGSIQGADQATAAYGIVSDRLANDISDYSNGKINVTGCYMELVPSDLKHAYDGHATAKIEGNIDLSVNDFLHIPEYLDTYDELVYAITYKNGGTHFCVSKSLPDGRAVMIEVVSKSRGAVQFKNMIGMSETQYQEYAQKYRRSSPNSEGSKSSIVPLRDGTASSDISIPDSAPNGNTTGQDLAEGPKNSADQGGKRFSLNPEFERQFNDWIQNTKEYERKTSPGYFKVGTTSDALKAIGVRDGAIYWRKQKIGYIMDEHPEMTQNIILQVPNMLENPVAVMKSRTRADSIVLFGDVVADNGSTVMAALELTPKAGGGMEAQFSLVTSAYGRSTGSVGNLVQNSEILYLDPDKKRTDTWLKSLRVQFPSHQLTYGSIGSIAYADGKVNISGVRLEDVVKGKSLEDSTTNSTEERHSIKGTRDLAKENARQKEIIEHLREQMKTSDTVHTDRAGVARLAKTLLSEYDSRYASKDLTAELQAVYDIIANTRGSDADFTKIQKMARAVAGHILEQSAVLNDTTAQDYRDLRAYLKDTALTLSEADRADVAGGYNEFRKAHMGTVRLKTGGMPVDAAYQELSERFGEGLFPADITHPADQLTQIADVLDSLKPVYENPYSANLNEVTTYLADDILERFFDVPQAKPTFADRQAEKLTQEKIKRGNQLRDLREQKNARIAEIQAENREKLRAALEQERDQRRKAIAQTKERYIGKDTARRDRAARSDLRRKIERHAKQLSGKLLRPTDKQHVPENLRVAAASLLHAINLESAYTVDPATGKRIRGQEGSPNKRTQAFQDVRRAYAELAKADGGPALVVDPDLQDHIDAVISFGDMPLFEMSKKQLDTVWKTIRAVEKSISNADKLLGKSRYQTVSQIGQAFVDENGTRKPFAEKYGAKKMVGDLLNMDMLSPADFLHEFGEAGTALWKELRQGLDTKIRDTKAIADFSHALLEKTDRGTLSGTHAKMKTFHASGGDITLTPAQVMSLYQLMKRPQAIAHILRGGIRQAPVMQKGKIVKSYEPVHVTAEDVRTITDSLTAEQKRVADGIGTFMRTTLSDWGNEASMELYGYRKFTEENYFPIKSDENYTKTEFAKKQDARVKNMGFTKQTVKGANNAIMIEDIFDVYTRHADDMATYHAFARILEDIERVYNFKARDAETGEVRGSVAQAIERTVGSRGKTYFRNLMRNVNEGIRSDVGGAIPEKLLGNYKAAAVGANIRVILQQPTAIVRASALIDPKYLAIGMAKPGNFELVKKYAPIAQWKDWGYFELDTGRQIKDIMLGTDSTAARLREAAMAPAGWADNITWARIWNACEAEAKAKTDLVPKSEAFYKAVAERFSEIVDRTQVVDSVLHRSQIMRSGNGLVRMATSFMAEPTKTYNLFRTAARDALTQGTWDSKKRLARTTTAILLSGLATAAAASLSDALRDDDDEDDDGKFGIKYRNALLGVTGEEETAGEVVKNALSGNIADNLNPLNQIPYAKDLMSMLQGYDVKRMDMSAISDTMLAVTNLQKAIDGTGKYTVGYALTDAVTKSAKLLGIPAYNLKRDLESYANGAFMAMEALGYNPHGAKISFEKLRTPVNDKNKKKWISMGYRFEQDEDEESAQVIYDMLVGVGIEHADIDTIRKNLYKKSEDFTKSERTTADKTMSTLTQSRGYKKLSPEAQEEAMDYARDYAKYIAQAEGGFALPKNSWIPAAQEAEAAGIDTAEYILWKLALKVANADGSLKQEEVIDVLDDLDLTREERDYLFKTKYKSDKNNPYK